MVIEEENILRMLDNVSDPEIPALSIAEMGILRGVKITDGQVVVTVTPTYSGCPAMYDIRKSIVEELKKNGVEGVKIVTVLSPAWTTDWMTDEAKRKLKESGIAPPTKTTEFSLDNILNQKDFVPCPFCDSKETELRAKFSATACKALYYCNACEQPFEQFKCH